MSVALPRISVVVPCYRHAEELRRCLAGLAAQTAGVAHEVIVVDSAGETAVAEAATGSGVRLVRSATRLCAGAARNLGVRHARGEWLAFLDADCVPEPGWLGAAAKALESGARLAGGPVLDARPLHPIAASDNLLQFADFPSNRPDGPATYFPGCNLAIRRTDFDAVGGFPVLSLPAGEDTQLCEVARGRWPEGLRFVRGMRVRHDGRATFREFMRHNETFGYVRGVLGLHLNAWQRRHAVHAFMLPPVAARRLAYILRRGIQWDRTQLARTVVLLPLLVPGLVAWASGFRRGLRAAGGHRR